MAADGVPRQVHLPEIVSLLTIIVGGSSWALRRAAAYGLLELHKV